jgi:hypothetical protein
MPDEQDAMNCAMCHRQAPGDEGEMIDAGWIPYYYVEQREMPGPICPGCRLHNLRLADDGEWESIVPPVIDKDSNPHSVQP